MTRSIPWLRVLIEGVVIVASILLAFGIDAWWEGRGDDDAREAVLTAMLADLEADSVALTGLNPDYTRNIHAATSLLTSIDDPALSVDSVSVWLQRLFFGAALEMSDAAFATAISTGSINLVQDPLRSQAVEYFEKTQPQMVQWYEGHDTAWWEFYEAAKRHFRPDLDPSVTDLWPPPDERFRVASGLDDVRQDNALLMAVYQLAEIESFLMIQAGEALKKNTALREMIEPELR